jgi:hypothetical protein
MAERLKNRSAANPTTDSIKETAPARSQNALAPFLTHLRHSHFLEDEPQQGHSETRPNLLTGIGLNFANFSECALISLKVLPDFDSTMRRFESSRPSHIGVRRCSHQSAPVRKRLTALWLLSESNRRWPLAAAKIDGIYDGIF